MTSTWQAILEIAATLALGAWIVLVGMALRKRAGEAAMLRRDVSQLRRELEHAVTILQNRYDHLHRQQQDTTIECDLLRFRVKQSCDLVRELSKLVLTMSTRLDAFEVAGANSELSRRVALLELHLMAPIDDGARESAEMAKWIAGGKG